MPILKYFLHGLSKVSCKSIKRHLSLFSFSKYQYDYLFCRHFNSNLGKYSNVENSKVLNVVFYGSDEISEVTLKALNNNRLSSFPQRIIKELHVVCVKSPCPVRNYATMNDLTIHTWPFSLPSNAYDIGVVVSFGHMIPAESIYSCKYGMINAHPSLLPRWRGAAPIFYAILNGDAETGVTITQVSPNKFDVGKILLQETYRIPNGCSSKELAKVLSKLAAEMVLKTLTNLPAHLEQGFSQPNEGVTYARKITPKKCSINWEEDTLTTIQRKLKAFEGYFNVYTFWKDMKVVLLKCLDGKETILANVSTLVPYPVSPGYCYFHKKRKVLFVKCKDGWCGITLLKIPKTGQVTPLSFYNGFMSKENPKECYFMSENKIN